MKHIRLTVALSVLSSPALAQDFSTTISVTTACEAMISKNCKGAFGFMVTANGSWTAGPDPATGRTYKGEVTSQEWSELRNLVKQFFATKPADYSCPARPIVPGVSETIIVKLAGKPEVALRGLGGKIDPNCEAAGASSSLFKKSDELMQKYYPEKF
jgi:hypothetical protein